MTLAAGARLGPYEIESLFDAGGFGEVYKARDARLGRLVALKVLLPSIAADETFRDAHDARPAFDGKELTTVVGPWSDRVLFSRQAFADYDVTADGKQFVFAILDPEAEAATINAILNWTALLRK
jgi:serine/threonine protein kinase